MCGSARRAPAEGCEGKRTYCRAVRRIALALVDVGFQVAAPGLYRTGPAQDNGGKVTDENIQELFEKNVERLDSDKNGSVGRDELDKAFQDPSFAGRDAPLLAFLKETFDKLQELSDDESGTEDDDITKKDVAEFERSRKLKFEADRIKRAGRDFDVIDSDKNGYLIKRSLIVRLKAGDFEGTEDALKMMRDRIAVIRDAYDDWGRDSFAITKKDLEAYKETVDAGGVGDIDSAGDQAAQRTALQQGRQVGSLWGNAATPTKAIKPEAMQQTFQTDC